jgi:dienelactone hydrolase
MRSLHVVCALFLMLQALAVQASAEEAPKPAAPTNDSTVVVDKARWPYSSADKHFHLWLPKDTPVIKGLYVIVFHGAGQHFAESASLRALSAELSCGVVGFDKFHGMPGNGTTPSRVLLDALKELATVSKHPEVDNAPIFTWGNSNGTMFSAGFASKEPNRVFGWMAFKSAFGGQFSLPEIYSIPGMVISGENDTGYFADQLHTVKKLRHEYGALLHIVVEAKGGHGFDAHTADICLAFMKTAFQVRVPTDADPRRGPVMLNILQETQGWLGQTLDGARVIRAKEHFEWEQPVDVRRKLEIAPYAYYPGDKGCASWFPTEDYARKCQAFCMNLELPQWSKTEPPRGLTVEERFAQAKRLEASDPPAAVTAYATFAGTQFAKEAAARLQDAQLRKRCQARELLKRMWAAELHGPMLRYTYTSDPKLKWDQLHKTEQMATIKATAAILLTRYADTADARTARVMLERYKLPLPTSQQ